MKLVSVESFYRMPFEVGTHIEDGAFVNARAGLFGVVDGVSAAYSLSHPPMKYADGLTGGQAVAREFCLAGLQSSASVNIEDFVLCVNEQILSLHKTHRRNPLEGHDVAGASFIVCQVNKEGIALVFGGDCFALVRNEEGLSFLTGFDEAAFVAEEKANCVFAQCLKESEGSMGRAWDIYYPHFKDRKIRSSNKNMGNGGYAELNGDPAIKNCWTVKKFSWSSRPQYILLGSDGILPSQSMNPKHKTEMTTEIEKHYLCGGIQDVLKWRDEIENSLHHITGWPEGSAIELKLV